VERVGRWRSAHFCGNENAKRSLNPKNERASERRSEVDRIHNDDGCPKLTQSERFFRRVGCVLHEEKCSCRGGFFESMMLRTF